jgi:hypothetical protein
MRIWSVHPRYLDAKGLVAVWREALLAKHVLEGKTKGYKNHPQLNRFKRTNKPVDAIDQYLALIYEEAKSRGYNFDSDKINRNCQTCRMTVTDEQLKYERDHLLAKLKFRDQSKYHDLLLQKEILPHPLFEIINGKIEDWEIRKPGD